MNKFFATIYLIISLFWIQAFAESETFFAKVVTESGNVVKSGNIILSPQNSPLKRKTFKVNDKGLVSCSASDFNGEVYWSFQHQNYANHGGAHLKLKEYNESKPFEIVAKTGEVFKAITVDAGGNTLSGLKVSLSRSVPAGDHTHYYQDLDLAMSDKSGNVILQQLKRGNVDVKAFNDQWITPKTLKLKHPSDEIHKIIVSPALKVSLEVVDGKQKAVDNVKISWYSTSKEQKKYDSKKISSKGSLNSGNVHPKEWQIPKSKYLHLKVTSNAIEDKELLNVELKKDRDLRTEVKRKPKVFGKVTNTDGKIITQAEVNLKYPVPRYFSGREKKVKSNDQGEYQVAMVKDGNVNVTVTAQGYLRKVIEGVEVKADEEKELNVELEEGQIGRFRFVTYQEGEEKFLGNNKLEYRLSDLDGKIVKTYKGETDDEGIYALKGWKSGDTVIFKLKGYSAKLLILEPFDETKLIKLAPTGGLKLVVKNEEAEAITKAKFEVKNSQKEQFSEKQAWREVKYDKQDKAYLMRDLSPGHYTIVVKAKGYMHSSEQAFHVKEGQLENVEIKLKAAQELTIEVTTVDGIDLEEITLVRKKQDGRYSRSSTIKKKSDEKYFTHSLDDTQVRMIQIKAEDYIDSKDIRLKDDQEGEVIYKVKLEKGLSYAGIVVDSMGMPVKEVELSIQNNNFRSQHFYKSAKSDSEGRFKIGGLKVGDFKFQAKKKGFANHESVIQIKESQVDQEIELKKGGGISGYIVNEQGERVKGAEAILMKQENFGFSQFYDHPDYKVTVGAEGEFRFDGIQEGSFRIDVKTEKGIGKSEVLSIQGEYVHEHIEVLLKEGLEISGKVVDQDGEIVKDLGLRTYSMTSGGEQKEARSNEFGEFKFSGLAEGSYIIQLENKDYELLTKTYFNQTTFEAGKKDVILKVQKSKLLSCRVVTPDEKEISQYEVFVRRGNSKDNKVNVKEKQGMSFKVLSTQVLNNFNTSQSFNIVVKAKGYNPGVSREISKQDFEQEVLIELKPEKALSLIVKNRDYQNLADVEVKYQLNNGQRSMNFYGKRDLHYTDEEGRVTIEGVASGDYGIQLSKAGYALETKVISFDENRTEPYELILGKGGTVRGYVRDADGIGIKGQMIKLREKVANNYSDSNQTLSNEEGYFEMNFVAKGIYYIFKADKNQNFNFFQNQDHKVIEVKDGEIVDVNLDDEDEADKGKILGKVEESGKFIIAMLMDPKKMGRPTKQVQFSGNDFEISGVEPGKYMIMVSGMRGDFLKKEIEVQAGETIEVVFEEPKMKITATVQWSDGEKASMLQAMLMAKGAVIEKNNPLAAFSSMGSFAMIQNGVLDMPVEKAGDYTLTINSMPGFKDSRSGFKKVELSITEGETLDLGTLLMDEGLKIRGKVVDELQNPIAGVTLTMDMSEGFSNNFARSNADGEVILANIEALPVKLSTFAKGYLAKKVEVSQDGFVIQLEKASSITVNLKGNRISGRSLELVAEDSGDESDQLNNWMMGMMRQNQMTNKFGKYTFESLKEGSYTIKVKALLENDQEVSSDTIYLNPKEEKIVEIQLFDE